MAITVDIDLGYEFVVKAPFKEVFDLVSDLANRPRRRTSTSCA
jgi:hypothetical protein